MAVASSLSTMRVAQLLKEEVAASARKEHKVYALGVNMTYNKHFAVMVFTAPALK